MPLHEKPQQCVSDCVRVVPICRLTDCDRFLKRVQDTPIHIKRFRQLNTHGRLRSISFSSNNNIEYCSFDFVLGVAKLPESFRNNYYYCNTQHLYRRQ